MKTVLKSIFFLSILLMPIESSAAEHSLVGKYEAIENNKVHIFYPSGDYLGARWYINRWQEFKGVYEYKNNICELTNLKTGDVMKYGNLLMYVNNSVCCFEVKFISNKISMNNLYERPMHYPDGICANAVLIKSNK